MSYRHIENLYKNKDILLFKQCYAMEKIHGTSAHIKYNTKEDKLIFFSGGGPYDIFIALFDHEKLLIKFRDNAISHQDVSSVTIYGEFYGGKIQKMSYTYGPNPKFIAFEVMINREINDIKEEQWMNVLQADKISNSFGIEFVYYKIIDTTEEAISAEMMADSVQAIRNNMGEGHMREGIVLRPLVELIHPNGGRIISKHKRPEFAERANTPKFTDPEKLKILEKANEIAEEWVVPERLRHVLDAVGLANPQMEDAQKIIKGMIEDVEREGKSEIVESKEARKMIGKKTMKLFKEYLMKS